MKTKWTENDRRAANAREVVAAYGDDEFADLRTNATDLLTDLFHLAVKEGWDIEQLVALAQDHLDAERGESI